ncbi:MAG: NAD(P)-dependent oxidoreductase [Anaerovoracaceae bacterium]|nr:NAD(P)-dependent oxidoreductase [Anaerovoracaceae bacterium]
MRKFRKITVIEPANLTDRALEELREYAEEVVTFDTIPEGDGEKIRRIGDSDAVIVSWTTVLPADVIKRCGSLEYIGMFCTLYPDKSCSVDLESAAENNVTVTGVSDYGDDGVGEFVVSELIRIIHGYDGRQWNELGREIKGMRFGVIGLGATGSTIANDLRFFGADVAYYSRTRKPEAERAGIKYMELNDLLARSEAVCTCLNRGAVLLGREQFDAFGDHKILFNTGLSPSFDIEALREWLDRGNVCICDTEGSLGDTSLAERPDVVCEGVPSGFTEQARERLCRKGIDNIKNYLG